MRAEMLQWHVELGGEWMMGDTVKVSEKQGLRMPRVDEIESIAEAALAAQSLKLSGLLY
jgi:hypothetical protein